MASRYSPGIPSSGLVFAVDAINTKSYPGSGTTWKDLGPDKLDGTITNATFNGTDAIAFDGTGDLFNNADTPDTLQGNPNFTVLGVFRRTANFALDGYWGIGGNLTDQGLCNWNYTNTNEIAIDQWSRSTFTSGQTFPLNEWHFAGWQKIAGNMVRSNCILWSGNTSYTGTDLTVLRSEYAGTPDINNQGITLGSISTSTSYCASVDIGWFAIYDRVLTSNEVIGVYNSLQPRFGY
jgi:hypothetical protein